MATIDDVAEKLAAHERIMQDRYEHLEKGLDEIKRAEGAEGKDMAGTVNVESSPLGGLLPLMMGGNWGGGSTAGAVGGGLGAGVLGGILGGALLGNRRGGILGGDGDGVAGNFVTPAEFQAGLNSVTASTNTNAILQGIGDLKTAVPVAEGQVQLALQGAQADINRNIDATGDQITAQISTAQLANANNFAATSRQLSDIIATSLQSQNGINTNVLTSAASTKEAVALYGNANLVATKEAATATALAVANSTKEILAALNDQNVANLQRQLTVAETALAEDRARIRSREMEINITNTNTATAQQVQMQTQQQQQFQILAQLAANVNNLAGDIQAVRQTQSNVNFGVQGNAAQTASAANNRVN